MTTRSTFPAYVLLGLLIVAAAFHVWWYRDLPIVRNSLIYAQISARLVEPDSHFSPDKDAYGKPLGFAAVSLPFVKAWGANVGLKISSWLWTSLWAISVVALFARLRERFGLGPQHLWLVLLLTLFNPLVFYQSMSAYPDTLFALTFLWSLYFLDRMLSQESRWFDGFMFALTVLAGVWVRHYGLIMLPILIAFLLVRRRQLPALWRERRGPLGASLAAFAILVLVLVAAREGVIPLFNLGTVEQNYTQSWQAEPVNEGGYAEVVFGPNLVMLAFYLVVTLGVCAPLLCLARYIRANLEWYVMVAIVIVAIVVYKGSTVNPRYFIPIAPLLATFTAATLLAISRRIGFAIIGLFIVANAYTTLYYNSIGFHDRADHFVPLPKQDNLRITSAQRKSKAEIDRINELAEHGAKNLIIVSDYYGDAVHYVLDEMFDPSLRIRYQTAWDPGALARMGPEPVIVLYYGGMSSFATSTAAELDRLGKRVSSAIWLVRPGA